MKRDPGILKNYAFSMVLIASIAIGAVLGVFLKKDAAVLKPLGDIFLNLLFTTVVPLVFFSISSTIAGMKDVRQLGKILSLMLIIFVLTGIVSSLLMVAGVKLFPPSVSSGFTLAPLAETTRPKTQEQIVKAFTATDFPELISKKNMLALIVFAILVGLATSRAGEKGRRFAELLSSGNEVMLKVIGLIMIYAPIGLGAYFAYLTGVFGPELFGSYVRAMALYYPLSLLYFFAGFSCYAWLAGGLKGVKIFWSNILLPSLTALGTGSSLATIPSNLRAADKIGVPHEVSDVIIPIGATIHMDGSCLAAILKIALLFSFFGMDFSGAGTIATAVGIAILCGVVMSGIPSGGFLGELLIVTLYGFPPAALPIISMVGTLVDPPATMVNAVGDNVASMIVSRMLYGKNWFANRTVLKGKP